MSVQNSNLERVLDNYKTLLGLAEYFRSLKPPFIKETIHCVQATLLIESLPDAEKAFSRLNLAKLLLEHTKNVGHAKGHLEEAHRISSYIKGVDGDKVFFESTSLLASICVEQNQNNAAKGLLQNTLERSAISSLKSWNYRLIFQLAEAHARDKEFAVAISLLSLLGEETAKNNNHHYVRLLFVLSKCMLYLTQKDVKNFERLFSEVEPQFALCTPHAVRREVVKCFAGFLKVYRYVVAGRPRSGKEELHKLQESVQLLVSLPDDSEDDDECVQWLSKEHLCILVYLVKVMHCMQSGTIERANRYSDKALTLIDKLKVSGNDSQLTSIFSASLLEHAVMCRLVQGQGSQAIKDISKVCVICQQDPKLSTLMKPAIHSLLGLYAMSMNLMAEAETHFKKTLRLSNNERDIYYVAGMNLAIIYIRHGPNKTIYLKDLLQSFNENAITRSKSLRSAYFYMQGLKNFFCSKFDDAKVFLGETIRIGNTEDMARITTCALVLLGHVVFSVRDVQKAMGLVAQAMQVANKIPDVYVQLWASSLLKDMYRQWNDVPHAEECSQLHSAFTQQLLQDHYAASSQPEHTLIRDFI